jgi:hypothetical protein
MMTPAQYDRLERVVQLMSQSNPQRRRESRKQTTLLASYLEALRRYDSARLILESKPDDSEAIEGLNLARHLLDEVREELKKTTARH